MNSQDIQIAIKAVAAVKSVPRWQREAEARLARGLASVFDKAAAEVLRQLAAQGVPTSDVTRAMILQPVDSAIEPMLDLVLDGVDLAAVHGRNSSIDALRKQGMTISKPPEIAESVRLALREKSFIASERTMSRLRGDVMAALSKAYEDGLGTRDAAAQLGEVFQFMRDYELERVARTEIHGAQSDAAHETLVEFGAQYEQWIAASDDRTRESHIEVDRQITRVGQPFSNGLLYPGDRNGPIEEWINCRCRTAPFIMGPGQIAPPGKAWFYADEVIDATQ